MRVFLSWSGSRSKILAEALRKFIPRVIQLAKPWMSEEDMMPGSRWAPEIESVLRSSQIGIICVTAENQHNPWLLFEAGALSRSISTTAVCPVLFGISPTDLTGPLTLFQGVNTDADGFLKLAFSVNDGLGENSLPDSEIEEQCSVWWPKLSAQLQTIPSFPVASPARSMEEQIAEILGLLREQQRRELQRTEEDRTLEQRVTSMLAWFEQTGVAPSELQDHVQRHTINVEAVQLPNSSE